MKLFRVAVTSLALMATSLVAAQYPADTDELFARQEFEESLSTRDYSADTLSHARRTLKHLRRLADDHAEFVARAYDAFDVLDSRSAPQNYADCVRQECKGKKDQALVTCKENCKDKHP